MSAKRLLDSADLDILLNWLEESTNMALCTGTPDTVTTLLLEHQAVGKLKQAIKSLAHGTT